MDQSTAAWLVGLFVLGALSLFFKGMHSKIENSASKAELKAAIEALKMDHEADRKELRENQIAIFNKLEVSNLMLAQVVAKVELLTQMKPFDQTYPGHRQK